MGTRAGMRNNRYGDREVVPYVMCVDAVSALHGQIEEGVLANLLQYLSLSQATGCLTLRHPDRRQGNVFLERGRVVFVDAKPLYDIGALSTLMRWDDGRFSFRTGVQPPRRTLKDSTETLLLEASHQTDVEDRVGAPALIGADTVLVPRSLGRDESTVSLSLAALHVWRALDGDHSLMEIASAADLPVTVVVAGATELMQREVAEYAVVPMVDPAFIDGLVREAVDIIGPVAEVLVEEAFYDLGLSEEALAVSAVDELIMELASQFRRSDWQLEFLRRAERLRQVYGVGV